MKSALSKTEFLDALEKVKTFKTMAPAGVVSRPMGSHVMMISQRSQPFGLVFAYGLSDNSLSSLVENLKEWEAGNPPTLWPNYLCVLEAGVIYHRNKLFEDFHDSNKITAETWPINISFGEDSLFKFYSALHDMCAHTIGAC